VNSLSVIFDACVLVPMHLRNLLMWMSYSNLFRPGWTEEIHQEWIRNVIKIETRNDPSKDKGLLQAGLLKTKKDMELAVPGALVSGYEKFISDLEQTHIKDRHVVAAAIRSHADLIVTYNTKDFSAAELMEYKIRAIHPDQFLTDLSVIDPGTVISLSKVARTSLKNPKLSQEDYLQRLKRVICKNSSN
jgi:predicted nucleic acid-binding protein